jgi:hypothetical protein
MVCQGQLYANKSPSGVQKQDWSFYMGMSLTDWGLGQGSSDWQFMQPIIS